ncbi:MAG TPA: N-acetylmuramoyl-L-alanine amidase [Terriglobia bacterium]|nr:N-acetylmuramoyl-L-alanine amidase [Terriglobia bacterium]
MNPHRPRSRYALILASLLAFPVFSFGATVSRERARAEFDRATRLRNALESLPQDSRQKADYDKVIWSCRTVYHLDPAFTKTPVALQYIGELYEEMGRRFSDKHAFQTSIAAYEFLMKEYPHSSFSRESLMAIAEIYRTDLADPVQAKTKFREYLTLYPKSEKAEEARTALKELQQKPLDVPVKSSAVLKSSPPEEPAGENIPRSGKTLEVTGVRRWVGPNYTRIVISVDGEVGFDASRLVSPDRLVFDLSNARPSPELMGKTFPFEDGFLHQIRVALYKPTITRVVLDVAHIEDYSVFSLPNPFRLVIDIHGPPAPMVAKDQSKKPAKTDSAAPTLADNADGKGKGSRVASSGAATGTSRVPSGTTGTTPETTGPQPVQLAEDVAEKGHPKSSKKSRDKVVAAEDDSPPIKTPPPTEAGSRTLTRALGLKIGRIVIDPGHGGHDTGTIGPTGVMEKDVVLDVGLRLARLLEQEGSEVVMTRHDDTFIPLEERTAIANEKAADLFISIHANASHDQSARGIETYYLNFNSNPEALEVAARENATSQQSVHELSDLIKKIALTEKVEESRDFATEVQREVHTRLVKASGKQKDRGVKKAPFVVLIGANMPSILAEISFLTNPKDERLLQQPEYLQKIAQALHEGVIHYVNNLGGVRVAQADHAPRRASSETPTVAPGRELNSPNAPNF